MADPIIVVPMAAVSEESAVIAPNPAVIAPVPLVGAQSVLSRANQQQSVIIQTKMINDRDFDVDFFDVLMPIYAVEDRNALLPMLGIRLTLATFALKYKVIRGMSTVDNWLVLTQFPCTIKVLMEGHPNLRDDIINGFLQRHRVICPHDNKKHILAKVASSVGTLDMLEILSDLGVSMIRMTGFGLKDTSNFWFTPAVIAGLRSIQINQYLVNSWDISYNVDSDFFLAFGKIKDPAEPGLHYHRVCRHEDLNKQFVGMLACAGTEKTGGARYEIRYSFLKQAIQVTIYNRVWHWLKQSGLISGSDYSTFQNCRTAGQFQRRLEWVSRALTFFRDKLELIGGFRVEVRVLNPTAEGARQFVKEHLHSVDAVFQYLNLPGACRPNIYCIPVTSWFQRCEFLLERATRFAFYRVRQENELNPQQQCVGNDLLSMLGYCNFRLRTSATTDAAVPAWFHEPHPAIVGLEVISDKPLEVIQPIPTIVPAAGGLALTGETRLPTEAPSVIFGATRLGGAKVVGTATEINVVVDTDDVEVVPITARPAALAGVIPKRGQWPQSWDNAIVAAAEDPSVRFGKDRINWAKVHQILRQNYPDTLGLLVPAQPLGHKESEQIKNRYKTLGKIRQRK